MPERPHLVRGVDHAAFPTFDPAATVHFYRDVLGFPVAHAITAVGWGPAQHPDFVHFFFDIGGGDRIAFFYYFGTEPYRDDEVPRLLAEARHLAIHVDSVEVLDDYQRRLDGSPWPCEMRVPHETLESIYVHDPNGYLIELTCPTRMLGEADREDGELTVEALLEVAAAPDPSIAKLWSRKAELIARTAERLVEVTP